MWSDTFHILIHTPSETVWELLLEWIEQPQTFCPDMGSAKIVERSAEGMIRELLWDGKMVREKILLEKNDGRIYRELLEHPIYSGRFITRIVPTSVQNPMAPVVLQIEVELERKSFKVEGLLQTDAELVADIEGGLQKLKKIAEEREHSKEGKGQHLSEGITHR